MVQDIDKRYSSLTHLSKGLVKNRGDKMILYNSAAFPTDKYVCRQALINNMNITLLSCLKMPLLKQWPVKQLFNIASDKDIGTCDELSFNYNDVCKADSSLSIVSNDIKRQWPPSSSTNENISLHIRNVIRTNYIYSCYGDVIFLFCRLLDKKDNNSDISIIPYAGGAWLSHLAYKVFEKDVFIFDLNTLKWYDYKYQEEISFHDMMEDVLMNTPASVGIYDGGGISLSKEVRSEVDRLLIALKGGAF